MSDAVHTLMLLRSAMLGPCLDDGARDQLSKDLHKILPGSREQKVMFLEEAELAIDRYRKITKKAQEDEDRFPYRAQLSLLISSAEAFARTVEKLTPDTRDVLLSEYFRRHHGSNVGHIKAMEAFERFEQGAKEARIVAEMARSLRANVRGRVGRGKTTKPRPDADIVGVLAVAYMRIYAERPSAEDEGVFARAVQEIGTYVPEARLASMGHTRLKRLLDGVIISGGARPSKRGRKSKVSAE